MAQIEVDPSQVHTIEVDPSQVSAAAAPAQPAFRQPEGSAAGRFFSNAWQNSVGGLLHFGAALADVAQSAASGRPLNPNGPGAQAIQGIVQGHIDQAQKAADSFKQGNYVEALGHSLATALPAMGPAAAAAGEKIGGSAPQFDRYGNVVRQGQAPDVAGGLGAAVGLVGTATAPMAGRAIAPRLPESIPVLPKITNPNPVVAEAVKWGMERNPELVDPATATGNPMIRGAQALADRSIGGSMVSGQRIARQTQAFADTGSELAQDVQPGEAVTAHQAGGQVIGKLRTTIQDLGSKAGVEYGRLREIEQAPGNGKMVPTGEIDAHGDPVIERMNLPIDMRPVKEALKPIYAQYNRTLPITDLRASYGLKAIDNILKEGDFKPASTAEMDLGALKEAARAELPELRDTSQGLAAAAVKDLDQAITAGVSQARVPGFDPMSGAPNPALQALQNGRRLTANKWQVADTLKSFGRKIDDLEPVQVYNQLTWSKDAGIERLREVADRAPEQMPAIGRAFIEGLLDTATQEGGFNKSATVWNKWQQLGPQTKQILFRNPALINDLDNFFLLAKKAAENPNPSGSGYVALLGAQGAYTFLNPLTGIPMQIGAAGVSKLLHSPKFARILTDGLRVPLGGSRAVVAANALSKMAEDTGTAGPPEPPDPGPGNPPVPVPKTPPAGPAGGNVIEGATNAEAASPAAVDAGRTGEGPANPGPDEPGGGAGPAAVGQEDLRTTSVRVPGQRAQYPAQYEVRELSDIQPSHSGRTFQPNPKYTIRNDRDYNRAENQGKIVNWSTAGEFDPMYHLTESPDASNGPPVVDDAGNVLGGNGRTMILDRVYSSNPQGAVAYKKLLSLKSRQFGIDPIEVQRLKQPVLVRRIADEDLAQLGGKQQAVTDFNKVGTAALRGTEKAIADSRRVSQDTLDHIGGLLEKEGQDGTLTQVLEGRGGGEVLGRLVDDGVIAPQERAAYENAGALTADGKARISKLLLGRFFRDPEQLDLTPPSIRNKLERIAAPLVKIESKPDWTLAKPMQEALELIEQSRVHGQKNLDDVVNQVGLLGSQTYSPQGIALAKMLQHSTPTELTRAVRQYAQDAADAGQGDGLFGPAPTPSGAFAEAFKVPLSAFEK